MNAGEKETGRVEAFSDGVFAIAITLLVLELKVPHLPDGGADGSLARALTAQWPSWVSLVTSFTTILIMWTNHHALFSMVHRIDARFLFANGLLLLVVTLVPFPTAVLAEYFTKPGAKAAAAFYGGTFVLAGIAYNLLWDAASEKGRGLLATHVSEESVARLRGRYRKGPPLYAVATVAAFVHAALTVAICAGLCIFWIIAARDELAAKRAAV